MKALHARLVVFFAGLPTIAALIVFLPGYSHATLSAVVVAACAVGAGEMLRLFDRRSIRMERLLLIPLSMIIPLAVYLVVSGRIEKSGLPGLAISPFAIIIIRHTLFNRTESFGYALPAVAGSFAVLIYPGLFASFFIAIAALPKPTLAYIAFLSMVFANDTAAYVFGMLFGRETRGVSRISPNKSIPGFVAGPVFSVGVALLYYAGAPSLFGGSLIRGIVVGIAVGAATIIGDLFESLLKRSAGVKDSGILVPGRGGVLDSVDSLFFAAPVFYLILATVA